MKRTSIVFLDGIESELEREEMPHCVCAAVEILGECKWLMLGHHTLVPIHWQQRFGFARTIFPPGMKNAHRTAACMSYARTERGTQIRVQIDWHQKGAPDPSASFFFLVNTQGHVTESGWI